MNNGKNNLCWIRRDLRLHDHHALSQSLISGIKTYVVFVFDQNILGELKTKHDPRIDFIYESLKEIEEKLNSFNSSLIVRYGDPKIEIPKVCEEFNIGNLYYNRDYEPYAKKRDHAVVKALQENGISAHDYKDHVFYEKHEVLTGNREIYKVFTPYKNKWLEIFSNQESIVSNYKCDLKNLAKFSNKESILKIDWYKKIGFEKSNNAPILLPGPNEAKKRLNHFKKLISQYHIARDFPSLNKTSNLSTYIRMGNLSIREMISAALEVKNEGSKIWLSEIIWRDFYQAILDAYPNIEKHCFKIEYDKIKWSGENKHFDLWCSGNTGYPIIDASMRCLNQTGMMHNRLRMIVASFLTKTLLIDWRKGENYFAKKLMDYDLAANNGGWQWSASTGVDAQPYFRIFNPYNQSEKFDPKGEFIKQWCPELREFSEKNIHAPHLTNMFEQSEAECTIGENYPYPIVDYKTQKDKALSMFKAIK